MAFLAAIPAWVSMAASLAGGAIGAVGAVGSAQAQAGAAKYNANVAFRNAAISKTNAQIAEQSGEAQAGISQLRNKAAIGAVTAAEGASGVDVSSGSFTDVKSSMRELGELDAQTIRSNAAREAFGYKMQGASHTAQGNLDLSEAVNASTAGGYGAASTFLSGAGSAIGGYQRWQQTAGKTLDTSGLGGSSGGWGGSDPFSSGYSDIPSVA